jgi:hypothetical protein
MFPARCVRRRADVVRAAVQVYNTKEDYVALATAVADLAHDIQIHPLPTSDSAYATLRVKTA